MEWRSLSSVHERIFHEERRSGRSRRSFLLVSSYLRGCSENRRLCGLLDTDAIAERFQLPDRSPCGALAVTAVEVVGAEFVVRNAIPHDEIRDFENLMTDGDDGFLVSPMAFDAIVPGLQRGAFGPRSCQAAFDERAT